MEIRKAIPLYKPQCRLIKLAMSSIIVFDLQCVHRKLLRLLYSLAFAANAVPSSCQAFPSLTSLSPTSLSTCFLILPLPVFGNSLMTPSSPIQKMYFGALWLPNAILTHWLIAFHPGRLYALRRGSSSTPATCGSSRRKVPTTSPYLASLIAMTAASAIKGCSVRRVSIS